jgi:alkylation response protein AidB-like acyl-CoA dehydrogenase
MSIEFNEEQQMWRDTLNTFMEKEVGREYTRDHDASRDFPWEVYAKMGKLGWLGLLLPEEDGGVAADPIMFAIFCEAIAKYSLDTAACIMTSVFTATNISVHGTAAQKAKYLPPFLRGERTFSIAMTEPQSGSDAAAARTKATLDGDEWVVNGNKTFCSGAHIPGTTIVLLARTGEERYKGLSLFILPNDAPGLTITPNSTPSSGEASARPSSISTTFVCQRKICSAKSAKAGNTSASTSNMSVSVWLPRMWVTPTQRSTTPCATPKTVKPLVSRSPNFRS